VSVIHDIGYGLPMKIHHTTFNTGIRVVLAAGLLLCTVFAVRAETINGTVVGVTDGDSATVLDSSKTQHKMRLSGIAPEKAQPYEQRSKEHLSQTVFGKQVVVEYSKVDRKYKRKISKIPVNGIDVNLEQVRVGMAWHYKAYAREQSVTDRDAYARAELAARAAGVGLWKDAKPVAPWDWRHGGKTVELSDAAKASGCPCGGDELCTGNKGGQYCIAPNGKRKYQ
jgi:micrococcal nuclease